jgi:hypothetical protein
VKRAIAIHRIEYVVITLVCIGVAFLQNDRLGWAFWIFLVAPDVFGLVPAAMLGRAPARGHLPPRGVALYNAWHTYSVPLVLGSASGFLPIGANPWPLLGWLIHISADRALGFGLRGDDGGQALF